MTHLITFTDDRMTISADKLLASAIKYGTHLNYVYSPERLPVPFKELAGDLMNEVERCNFYVWKPYIIWDYMKKMNDGDILIYADAGQTFVAPVQQVINYMDQDIMMFATQWPHVEWCKMDVLEAIIPSSEYCAGLTWNRSMGATRLKQVQASLIFFRVTPEVRNFVKEWMLYCLMPGFCDNSPSKIPNYPTFAEHRWDQAVLTCLQIRDGYKLHRFPVVGNDNNSQYPNDKYKAITDHHRKRNGQWT